MRPIDGDKLIEWLDASLEDCINCKANTIAGITALNIDSFKRFIAEQPTIDQYGTWVPCRESKPRKGEKVIISTKTGVITMGYYVDRHPCSFAEGFECDSLFMLVGSALAWMPLPEPYREEKKDE